MKRTLALAAVLLAIFLVVLPAQSKTVYVKADGSDALDGSSWASAKQTVQAGINAAAAGDDVWVAEGTYVGCITHKSGVGLYGGFSGVDGETVATRDYKTNVTIIDGNKQGNVIVVPKMLPARPLLMDLLSETVNSVSAEQYTVWTHQLL